MADPKMAPTKMSVGRFLDAIEDERRRRDCKVIAKLMRNVTGITPRMWGSSIVGFGTYHYRYASGREGDWPLTGFSPRKRDLTLYIMAGFERYASLMKKLGKFRTGKSCLYIKKLEDVNLDILEELIAASVKHIANEYPVQKS